MAKQSLYYDRAPGSIIKIVENYRGTIIWDGTIINFGKHGQGGLLFGRGLLFGTLEYISESCRYLISLFL